MADTATPPAAGITRSDSVWLDDGNIIIQAETTQYKVHRSILSAHSSVFKDMFSVPQPSSAGEVSVEGCPVVHISDTAEDATAVLEALFLRMYSVAGEPLSIKVVAAFLRLGKKYEMELLHADALKRLRYEFPSTLLDLDQCSTNSMIIEEINASVAVANLAREQSLLCVLPLALYWCCRGFSGQQLATGIPGLSDALSTDNIPACFAGWSALGNTQNTTTLAWIHPPASTYPNCTSPVSCAYVRQNTLRRIYFPRVQFVGGHSWSELISFLVIYGTGVMCSSCNSLAEQMHNDGRAKFWEALPGIFGLPDWAELTKE